MLTEDQRKYIERLESGEDDVAIMERLIPAERPTVAAKEERITLRLDRETVEIIDNACERMGGTTRSTVIRWAIAEWVRRYTDLVAPLDEAAGTYADVAATCEEERPRQRKPATA